MKEKNAKKEQLLFKMLITSGGLNILFLGLFFYFVIYEPSIHFAYSPLVDSVSTICSPEIIDQFEKMTLEELDHFLSDTRIVKDGYAVRDFTLGALVKYHHIDIQKGLGKKIPQNIREREKGILPLFQQLSEEDFQKIKSFLRTEKYPFTTQGLFQLIQKQTIAHSKEDLLAYFCQKNEFILFATLFARSAFTLTKGMLLQMITEGDWNLFNTFSQEAQVSLNLSDTKRRVVLSDYLKCNSKTAAYILLCTDFEYALHQLDNAKVAVLLNLLTDPTKEAYAFTQKVATSARNPSICLIAKKKLAQWNKKEIEKIYSNKT